MCKPETDSKAKGAEATVVTAVTRVETEKTPAVKEPKISDKSTIFPVGCGERHNFEGRCGEMMLRTAPESRRAWPSVPYTRTFTSISLLGFV